MGEVVGYGSIKSASGMNGAIVVFLDSTAKAGGVVENAVVIKETFTTVLPLVSPATKGAPPTSGRRPGGSGLERHLKQSTNHQGAICGGGYKSPHSLSVGAAVISLDQHATVSLDFVKL
ncbi:hypothetical protein F2P81_025555 [Scophthalmus maximus]|uniref:Uncharacterized protein n=1 Tax=Scophthalmus maximus TaxID=52904 RepID=A0A6A4RUG4_SCOMX|nr:hypothetical protein F2P81_025555 [Scophthalmus maximus]